MLAELIKGATGEAYQGRNGKQRTEIAARVAEPATRVAMLAAEGEMFRRCRVKIDAAQVDIAAGACISHTLLSEIENGVMASDRHHQRVRLALLRIAAQRLKLAAEAIEELVA